jgi:flagellar FliL protein
MAAKAKTADADDVGDEVDEKAAPKKRKFSLKLMVIALGGLLVVAGGGAAAYFSFAPKKEPEHVAPVVKPVAFIEMPDVLVNLANPGGDRPQFLKVKIVIEVAEQAMVAQITPFMPRVLDAFQTYLRELRAADLDGSAGLYRLREELTRRVNAAIDPHRVNAVLFKELVIQ